MKSLLPQRESKEGIKVLPERNLKKGARSSLFQSQIPYPTTINDNLSKMKKRYDISQKSETIIAFTSAKPFFCL